MISARDVDNIYKVPLVFRAEGVDDLVLDHFGIEAPAARPGRVGGAGAPRRRLPRARCRIALVGKYVQLEDAYKSVIEALNHGGFHHGVDVEVELVDSEDFDPERARGRRRDPDPRRLRRARDRGQGRGGADRARERRSPTSGICLGMQIAVVEFARHVAGMDGANSAEFDPETPYPVVDLLPEQKEVSDMGGTMRLGADPVKLHEGTQAREIFGEAVIYKRHRHRYEVNNHAAAPARGRGPGLPAAPRPTSAWSRSIELPDHPFFVASQFHPEFNSRPTRPEPLFREFVGAAARRAGQRGPAAVEESADAEEAGDIQVRRAG